MKKWIEVSPMLWECVDKTPEETAADLAAMAVVAKKQATEAVQKVLDTTAQLHGYDNIVSACSYAGAPNAFQLESIAFITWRGAVWAHCYSIMAAVESGAQTMPTIEELIAGLPQYV